MLLHQAICELELSGRGCDLRGEVWRIRLSLCEQTGRGDSLCTLGHHRRRRQQSSDAESHQRDNGSPHEAAVPQTTDDQMSY